MHLAIFIYLSSNDQYAFGNNFYWYLFTRNKTSAYLIDKILNYLSFDWVRNNFSKASYRSYLTDNDNTRNKNGSVIVLRPRNFCM